MGFRNSRTRYEGELVKILCEKLEGQWFGQRGTHSYGVDVIMFKSTDNPQAPRAVLFEVKSLTEWPFYLSGRNKAQYETYTSLYSEKGVEVIYAIRLVGGKGDKWRFVPLSGFSTTNRGNPCVKNNDGMDLLTFVHTIESI